MYLVSIVNESNELTEEINKRIQCVNKCYCELIKVLKSQLLPRTTKNDGIKQKLNQC